MIEFSGVWKEFASGGVALKDVSFQVDPGEFAFITGHSGSGKTTALRLAHMADTPSRGHVRVAGHTSPGEREVWKLRRRVAKVFQDFKLLEARTALANVAFALEVTDAPARRITARAEELLSQVGLESLARTRVSDLSGGERQRVAIARALATEPVVLLADEPTGNLDERATRAVMDLFSDIHSRGTLVLMATHDLALVRSKPEARVLELDSGTLVYDSGSASRTAPAAPLFDEHGAP